MLLSHLFRALALNRWLNPTVLASRLKNGCNAETL